MKVLSLVEFAAKRRTDQEDMEKDLFPDVTAAMERYPAQGWYNDLLAEVARLYVDTYHREGGQGTPNGTEQFVREVRDTLDKTQSPDDNTVDRVSVWLSTAILNAATMEATATDEEFLLMEWVTMHDEDVRATHKTAEGQQRPPGEPYEVGGETLRYPGDPTASIELWINCRCTLAPVLASLAAAANKENTMTETIAEPETVDETVDDTDDDTQEMPAVPLAWYGVLAPEGVMSGDKRQFAPGSLRFRDLPLPLTWQKATADGHGGSVTIAKIERIVRVDNQMRASGHMLSTPEADEAVGMIAEFGKFGVSVDADDAEFEFDEESAAVTFTSARIASAAMVTIPAFAEAFLTLGDAPPEFMPEDEDTECDPNSPDYEACLEAKRAGSDVPPEYADRFKDYDAKQRKKAHTVPGTDSYPIEDCEDLRNAIQAIGRAKDPAATKRHIKSSKSRLGCSDVSIPEGWSVDDDELSPASLATFDRGPGWITNPVETRRIHNYWTRKGEEGYAKINWGVPGDFNRCRVLVGEKIAENSPEDLIYLNQICALWHHDALGWWPGRPTSVEAIPFKDGIPAAAITLTASGGFCAPSEWFRDPEFIEETPLTVTEDGRVFGHLAGWTTCHTAYKGMCVAPPKSASGYAHFLTGYVVTDDGTVPVGQITLGGGHAPHNANMRAAIAHYDNTCTAVADVTCGEDDHGIWLAGMVRPGTSDETVYALRASSLSGDWREGANGPEDLELIAALAVNSPGFPVPRVGVEGGRQVALVAAGVVTPGGDDGLDIETLAAQIEQRIADRAVRRERMAALRARVGGEV